VTDTIEIKIEAHPSIGTYTVHVNVSTGFRSVSRDHSAESARQYAEDMVRTFMEQTK
jgi:hypothetical protein